MHAHERLVEGQPVEGLVEQPWLVAPEVEGEEQQGFRIGGALLHLFGPRKRDAELRPLIRDEVGKRADELLSKRRGPSSSTPSMRNVRARDSEQDQERCGCGPKPRRP